MLRNNFLGSGQIQGPNQATPPESPEVTMRFSLPLFEKRLLPDYKEGDVLEGQVTSTTKRGVFLDIGAVVDGYLPESPESYSKGQMVKVAIKMIEVPRTQITLALV